MCRFFKICLIEKMCQICELRSGVTVSCDAGLCPNAFHLSCANRNGLLQIRGELVRKMTKKNESIVCFLDDIFLDQSQNRCVDRRSFLVAFNEKNIFCSFSQKSNVNCIVLLINRRQIFTKMFKEIFPFAKFNKKNLIVEMI